jgi:D-alanyl-lipoteichoic acid acyltransferase DltB (MBOAT superfamily)
MSFTSLYFFPFIVIVLAVYWFALPKKSSYQNTFLLLASAFFIGINDWKAGVLIAISGALNYMLVRRMYKLEEGNSKKWFFYAGCLANVFVLGYFKYLHDVINGFSSLFHGSGAEFKSLYLPLGISFFTFQLIGYWIDVYNEEIEPENDALSFFTYLFYFPKLISGPIERVHSFTPQLTKNRLFEIPLMTDALRQFLWGFFKKTVVSAHCLLFYKSLYANPDSISGINVLLVAITNMVYIYADFSGYSDMACGISKSFGIRITNNFAFPFFATNISEFWKRWHISLTSWVMKYVYTPVSFLLRKYNRIGTFLAIASAFLTVGVWHGLQSGYIVYGILQAIFFLPLVIQGRNINATDSSQKTSIVGIIRMTILFLVVCIAALLFREMPASHALKEMSRIATHLLTPPDLSGVIGVTNAIYWLLIASCFAIEWLNRKQEHGLSIQRLTRAQRWSLYLFVMTATFFFSEFAVGGFIYAQF